MRPFGARAVQPSRPQLAATTEDRAFRVMCNGVRNGLMMTDLHGHHLYANPAMCRLIAIPGSEVGSPAAPPTYVPADQHRQFWQSVTAIEAGATSASAAIELAGTAGSRFLALFTVVARQESTQPAMVWLLHEAYDHATNLPLRECGPFADSAEWAAPPPAQASDPHAQVLHGLTAREHQIIGALLDGRRVGSIARLLDVSEHTIRNHLASIFRKLEVHSQDEVIDQFRKIGLDEPQ